MNAAILRLISAQFEMSDDIDIIETLCGENCREYPIQEQLELWAAEALSDWHEVNQEIMDKYKEVMAREPFSGQAIADAAKVILYCLFYEANRHL